MYFVVIILALAVAVYFVGGVSRQVSPIQSYEYLGSINDLVSDISNYTKIKSKGKYLITDTIGNIPDDYAIRLTIKLQTDSNMIEYDLKIEPQDNATRPIKTKVYLTKAYNETTNSGGYQAESVGIKPLVDFFNSDFLPNVKKLNTVN
jgi:hypothetical protein